MVDVHFQNQSKSFYSRILVEKSFHKKAKLLKIKAETRWNLGFAFADATPDNTFGAQVKLFLGFQLLH